MTSLEAELDEQRRNMLAEVTSMREDLDAAQAATQQQADAAVARARSAASEREEMLATSLDDQRTAFQVQQLAQGQWCTQMVQSQLCLSFKSMGCVAQPQRG